MLKQRLLASINITPLVDALLVLVAVLLLVMPLLVKRLPVELPATRLDAAPVATQALRLALAPGAQLYLEQTPVPLASVLPRLTSRTTVELAVDSRVPYRELAQVIADLQQGQPREIVLLSR